jgi:hypothetical protein
MTNDEVRKFMPVATDAQIETMRKILGDRFDAVVTASGTKSESTNKPMQGVGDVIERMTSAVGIKKCGACEERRKRLNEMFPFNKPQ